ncbi:hypothetical protein GH733_015718 [Mirounga leonina]|nr:hypothetical protein GH733_015718 [Mirounga leonina]
MCSCRCPCPLPLPPRSRAGSCGDRAQFENDAVLSFADSPGPPKGEKGEERDKAKKEKGINYSDWKPETGLSPPRKKRGEEPKDRTDSVDSKSSTSSSPKRPPMERLAWRCSNRNVLEVARRSSERASRCLSSDLGPETFSKGLVMSDRRLRGWRWHIRGAEGSC